MNIIVMKNLNVCFETHRLMFFTVNNQFQSHLWIRCSVNRINENVSFVAPAPIQCQPLVMHIVQGVQSPCAHAPRGGVGRGRGAIPGIQISKDL